MYNNYWISNVKAKIKKIINIIRNCIACILTEKKYGRQEGFLNLIEEEDIPLEHISH